MAKTVAEKKEQLKELAAKSHLFLVDKRWHKETLPAVYQMPDDLLATEYIVDDLIKLLEMEKEGLSKFLVKLRNHHKKFYPSIPDQEKFDEVMAVVIDDFIKALFYGDQPLPRSVAKVWIDSAIAFLNCDEEYFRKMKSGEKTLPE